MPIFGIRDQLFIAEKLIVEQKFKCELSFSQKLLLQICMFHKIQVQVLD